MLIAVVGGSGRMGRAMADGVERAGHQVVARLDRDDPITPETLNGAEVALEFTHPDASKDNVLALMKAGVHVVVGTTGWTDDAVAEVEAALEGTDLGVIIAPNFSLSAVLAMSFARQAAQFFESAEVIELHHPNKVDAPSGTALATAHGIAQARRDAGLGDMPDATQSDCGSRGAHIDGVPVHAVRLQGLTAHEEILFGNPGEQLVIRSDCFDRESFVPGVLLAVRNVVTRTGVTVGIDQLLN